MNRKLVRSLGACAPASYRLSNGITDKYLLSIEGLCSITKDAQGYDSCQGVAEVMIYDWRNK